MEIERPQTPLSAASSSTRIIRSRHSISSSSSIRRTPVLEDEAISKLKRAIEVFQERPLVKEITSSVMALVEAVQAIFTLGAPASGILFSQPVESTVLTLLSQVTLKDTMDAVSTIAPQDPAKQLQVWIIIALNEALLPTYLQVLSDNDAPKTAGYSPSPLLSKSDFLIAILNELISKTEFQLHLEDFVEYKPSVPEVKISGSIISRTSPSVRETPDMVGLVQLSMHSPTPSEAAAESSSDMDSTKESPRSAFLEPVPISPPSPLIQSQPSIMYTLWNQAAALFAPTSPSFTTSTSICSNVESLLNIREGIMCGSLLNQRFKCPQCQAALNPTEHNFQFCEFSGKFYCLDCIGELTSINPFRVLNNWDFDPQPMYHALQRRVQGILERESFLLSEELIESIPVLREFRDARIQLSHLFAILLVKGDALQAESIRAQLGEHAHLVTESADIFTINDLHALHQRRLTTQKLANISSSVQQQQQ